jgi:hypothetical protein
VTRAARELVWMCEVCDKPVADGSGYVCVSLADVAEHGERWNEWMEKHPSRAVADLGFFLDTYPKPVPWRVLHEECDPRADPYLDDYGINVAGVRTEKQVIAETARLLGMPWLQATNWADVLRSVGGEFEAAWARYLKEAGPS